MRLRFSAVILGAALLVLAWLVLAALPGRSLSFLRDPVRLREWLRQWGAWVPLAIVLAQAVQVILAPIPGHVVGLASGYLLGVGWGTFYSVVGTAVGSLVAFALARAYGRPLVVRLVPPTTLARLDTGARRRSPSSGRGSVGDSPSSGRESKKYTPPSSGKEYLYKSPPLAGGARGGGL